MNKCNWCAVMRVFPLRRSPQTTINPVSKVNLTKCFMIGSKMVVFQLSSNQWTCGLHRPPRRSLFQPVSEEPWAGRPAQRLPGRVWGDGGGDGEVLRCDDRKGTSATVPGWGGRPQAVGGQQQSGGSGGGGTVGQVRPTSRRPGQSCTHWPRTGPRTSHQCCWAIGLCGSRASRWEWPLYLELCQTHWNIFLSESVILLVCVTTVFCTCLYAPASGHFL